MITLTITADTPADLKTQLVGLLAPDPFAVIDAVEAEAAPVEKPKTTRRAKVDEPKAEEPEVQAAADTTDTPALDFNTDVAPVVVDTVERFGKPVVVEVFSQFGVGKASEVPAERWGELITALNDAAAVAKPLA